VEQRCCVVDDDACGHTVLGDGMGAIGACLPCPPALPACLVSAVSAEPWGSMYLEAKSSTCCRCQAKQVPGP
jgi:hypothetical protein